MIIRATDFLRGLGAFSQFAAETLRELLRGGVRRQDVLAQMYEVGVRSLPTTIAISLFVGAIMAIQIYVQIRDFGAVAYLGGLSTSVTIRNVGPVLIAFLLAGKVGAFTSAELATMQITDQMSAIRCLGMNPVRYLIVPRLVAVVLSSFLLLVVGLFLSSVGGALISEAVLGVNHLSFMANISTLVTGWSVGTGLVKSFVFGNAIGLVSCYRGYTAEGGAEAVGKAVRQASVEILVLIIVSNFLVGMASEGLYELLGRGTVG